VRVTNRPKFWLALATVGFAIMTCSAVMAFLADHHWYVTYQIAEWFDESFWWVQLAGAILSIIAGIGMAKNLTDTLASRIGVGLILAGLLLIVFAGGPSAIFNIHDWEIALVLPVLITFLDGTILIYIGLFR
jgi:hypothetical protein